MQKKVVLAVDDEKDVLELLSRRLIAAGYEVLTITNGKDAIEIAKRDKPHLIILDILMPEMDGSQVAAILHEDPATKDIPILFLTCLYTKKEERVSGHEVGHNFFVAKPYDPKELLDEIAMLIGDK
ncbi:MAG: response regulator [Candidatus Omnitrophota bacterium]